jgi:ubiquinone/menaquinone biosynthesis C-methylase UbiE
VLKSITPLMRCPGCSHTPLDTATGGVRCPGCGALYPMRDGILDMLGDTHGEVITPFQRVMQSGMVVSIYENSWRPAGYFIASSRSFRDEVDTVLKLASGAAAGPTLDLACGPGVFTRPLARCRQGIVVGFDMSLPMLRHARRRIQRDSLSNVILIRGTAFRLPFTAGIFQLVNCCGALHLFDSPDQALGEIRRVSAPGGSLSVQTTIRPERSAGMAWLLERFIRFGFFEEPELRSKIQNNGFCIRQTERHRISFTFLARRIS